MKLHSISVLPKRPGGWESGELLFGERITELFGPNGCGKTPIIKSVAYALGYPVRYREDIVTHCDAVVLKVADNEGETTIITRKIGRDFDVEISTKDGGPRTFYNEKDFSQAMFETFGLSYPILTSVSNEPTTPYMATVLPIFYLDQDVGYTSAYRAPASFIKDQYAEMSRLVFGLSPKNSFEIRKVVLEKKRRLDQLDRLVVKKEERINELTNGLGRLRRPLEIVSTELSAARASLDGLRTSHGARSDAQVALDSLIYEKKSLRRHAIAEISEVQSRIRSFSKIQAEIEIELNTLSLNEESRRLFASFKDICANSSCGLFLGSSESYGKSLLYLRDQMKDLEHNNVVQGRRIEALTDEVAEIDRSIAAMDSRRSRNEQSSDVGALVEAIGELTGAIISLREEYSALEAIGSNEDEYVRILNERQSVQDEIASLDTRGGGSDLRALRIRGQWRERIRHWLDVLQTRNISRDVTIDADFDVTFGGEKLAQFTGSTLLRVVLALRTAAFEVYLSEETKLLNFLILDTPRQQDIEKEALARFVAELKRVAVERNAQVIFSTTDYHYDCADDDAQWSPQFDGVEQKMFLRVAI